MYTRGGNNTFFEIKVCHSLLLIELKSVHLIDSFFYTKNWINRNIKYVPVIAHLNFFFFSIHYVFIIYFHINSHSYVNEIIPTKLNFYFIVKMEWGWRLNRIDIEVNQITMLQHCRKNLVVVEEEVCFRKILLFIVIFYH